VSTPNLLSFYFGGTVAALLGVMYVSQHQRLNWPERIAACVAALIWPVALVAALTLQSERSS
jgi:hypothetical protein